MPKIIAVFVLLSALGVVSSGFAQDANLANSYFPIFPHGAGEDTTAQLLPVVSNYDLADNHTAITRAVVVVPDFTRNAEATAAMIASLAGTSNADTFIIAPQFLIDSDIPRLTPVLGDQAKMLARWPLDGWIAGGDSLAIQNQKSVSAFTALDLILLYLGEKTIFPNLRFITIAGHGDGADFVQRYASVGQAPDILAQQQIATRFLVANASSYLYFTAPRFSSATASGKPSLGTPDIRQCPLYNAYPYGLEKPNAYVQRAGVGAIKLRASSRNMAVLVGGQVAQGDARADSSCAALLQGTNRMERSNAYQKYLLVTYGDDASKITFSTVAKAGFEPAAMFGSPCGMTVLFGDGLCR